MQALFVTDGQLHYSAEYAQPSWQPDEALLRVRLAGICTTDIEILKGYVPGFTGVLGHEFVGEVVASADAAWHGRRVVASINIGCGHCAICQKDGPEHCPTRQTLGIHRRQGTFADYVAVPLRNLHLVPDEVSDEAAVFTEPLAAALRLRQQLHIRPLMQAAVIGPGRLGLLAGQVLALDGTAVTFLGRSQASLALPAQLGFATALASELPDNQFDLVIEATGNEAGFAQAIRLVRPLGTIGLKSTFASSSTLNLNKLVVSEITVRGTRCGPFAPALRLLAQGRVQVAPLIAQTFPLSEGVAAFAYATQPNVRKVLLRP